MKESTNDIQEPVDASVEQQPEAQKQEPEQ